MSHEWGLTALTLRNFRPFEAVEVEFERDVTVVVGRNGTGKTALLDGISVMLATVIREFGGDVRGFYAEDARRVPADLDFERGVARMSTNYPVCGKALAMLDGEDVSWVRERAKQTGRTSSARNAASELAASLFARAEHDDVLLPVIAYYGVSRVGDRRDGSELGPTRSAAYAAALDPRSDRRRLGRLLEELTLAVFSAEVLDGRPAAAARSQLASLEQACRGVLKDSGWSDPRWNPRIKEITLTHRELGTLPLSSLAAGIRTAAGVALDLASRAARANPRLGAEELLERVPGIVLIDEIELHLHPGWQQTIVPSLMTTFPKVQFIVTTHSPQVVSSVDARCLRDADRPGRLGRYADYANGLRSDKVLQSLMGTDATPDTPARRVLDAYLELVYADRGTTSRALALRERVLAELGDHDVLPELADADAYMTVTADVD